MHTVGPQASPSQSHFCGLKLANPAVEQKSDISTLFLTRQKKNCIVIALPKELCRYIKSR